MLGPVWKWKRSRQSPRAGLPHCDARARAVSRQAQIGDGLLELQRDPHAERGGQLGGLAQRGGGAREVVTSVGGATVAGGVGRDDQGRHAQLGQEGQPAAEVVPVRLAAGAAREQQAALRRPRPRDARRPIRRARPPPPPGGDCRKASSFVSQSSTADQPPGPYAEASDSNGFIRVVTWLMQGFMNRARGRAGSAGASTSRR